MLRESLMISKDTQYPGIIIMQILFFHIVTYIPKIRDLALTLAEVKPVSSYMTYTSFYTLFKIKKNVITGIQILIMFYWYKLYEISGIKG